MNNYTVKLGEFNNVSANSPLDAAKETATWIKDSVDRLVFSVTDERTNEEFNVDLDDEETPVLELVNGSKELDIKITGSGSKKDILAALETFIKEIKAVKTDNEVYENATLICEIKSID
jgi:hypothetical protein